MIKWVHGVGDDHAGYEQQVVARQEESYKQTRFCENDEHHQVESAIGDYPFGIGQVFYEVDNLRHGWV